MAAPKRLIVLITEDWFFLSHFLERALAARAAGYDVVVAARDNGNADRIRAQGLRFVSLPFDRRGLNPLRELRTVLAIRALYRAETPAVVHHIALKPIIYGSLVAGRAGVVNAPVGMGFVFASDRPLARLLRPLVQGLLKLLLNPRGSRVVFENADDLGALVSDGMVRRPDAVLIRGAGVDTDAIQPASEPDGPVRVVLVARMLRHKGIEDFVAAARILHSQQPELRFTLVGGPDPENRASLTEEELQAIAREGVVDWLGFRSDVADILAASHIAVLPSYYREGLPKVLLEAMAAGRPVIATDVPGCREAVVEGRNGFIVPPRDPEALAAAIGRLAGDRDLRRQMGIAGRMLAESEFSTRRVVAETLSVYADVAADAERRR